MEAQNPGIDLDREEEAAGRDNRPSSPSIVQWLRRLGFWRRKVASPIDVARKAFEEKSFGVALANYELALEQQPDSVEARRGISLVLLHRGGRENLQSALSHIEIALRLSPYRSGLYRIKSAIYSSCGMIERAKLQKHNAAVVAGLPSRQDDPNLQNLAGIVMQGLRLPELAMEHFRHAIRLRPQHDVFVRNLAIVLFQKSRSEANETSCSGDLAGALTEALHALELKRMPATLLLLAMIYQQSGAFDRALKTIEEVEKLEPSQPGLARLKGEVIANIEEAARYAVGETDDPAVERLRAARNRTAEMEPAT